MKHIHLLVLSLVTTMTVSAQTNTYPFPASGNVGIGTTAPTGKLTIVGSGGDGHSVTIEPAEIKFRSDGMAHMSILGPTNSRSYFSIGQTSNSYLPGSASIELLVVDANGNVGIGTTSPLATLQIKSATNKEVQIGGTAGAFSTSTHYTDLSTLGSVINLSRSSDGAFAHSIFSYTSTGGDDNLGIASRSDIKFVVGSIPNLGLIIKDSGNVGIGTTTPNARLHVVKETVGDGGLIAAFGSPAAQRIQFFDELNSSQGPKIYSNAGFPFIIAGAGHVILQPAGNVGIGETNPQHKLAVNGTIKAKEVIVETTGWSDYVFADNYALQPLAEVEAHIKTNKHLPGIPSAAQVAEQGVSIGDMQARLLAKIEELTLHQIAQEKLLKAQTSQLAAQADELTALRAEVRTSRH